jgi:hypothetical protein
MWIEPSPPDGPLSLGGYVEALVTSLGAGDPEALARLRRVVGPRRARIVLDDAAIDVEFRGDRLVVSPAGSARVHGEGATDRDAVLDLLDGHLEVTDAILDGRLRVRGATDATVRMFTAIEILLDASSRVPALQALASHFRRHPPPAPRAEPRAGAPVRRTAWYPDERPPGEDVLLARHDLLPDAPARSLA